MSLLVPAAFAIAGSGKHASASTSGETCLGVPATIVGTPGDDRLRGTPHDDSIVGLGGNDRIIGGGGHDVICGGPGDDLITTGKGPDEIAGGPGDDRLYARRGPDLLYGGPGNDLLNGGPGKDGCRGGGGEDRERSCEHGAPKPHKEEGGSEGGGHEEAVNHAPGAVGDSVTTDKLTAKTIGVLANDTDMDGDPLTVVSVDTTSTRGKVAVGPGGANVVYDPRGRFEELGIGQHADDSFTYTISDGHGHTATAPVAVTVTGVDNPPTAADDAITITEDDPATAVPVLANDPDIDGGPKSIEAVTQPANGTVAITGGGSGLTYQPAPNYCNSPPGTSLDTFSYTLNGGSKANVTVTVMCVNDPPSNLALSPSSIPENQPVGTAVGSFSSTDPDLGDTHTYTLVTGSGSTDNGSFEISGSELKTKASFDFETKSSYAIRVKTTDAGGLSFEKELTVAV
ncbi:MAG TPA: Ig-like domain-containing protein, partial [Solirubrobacterales bacterium]|nr:Ig-like domain-containing protein [Solirubrobacterales bacterium]